MTALPRDAEFYLRHSGYVRTLARQVVFDAHAAEDIAQETWLAALERPPRDGRSPRGWLKSLVRGLALKAWLSREAREQREHAKLDTQLAPPTPDELVAHESARRRVADALLALEEPYRSALWLRYFEDLPPREIATRLGLPVETVRTHVKRGLEKLRARLRRESGAVWSVALVGALDLEPLSYRAAARATAKTLLRGLIVVGVAKKVLVASAAIAVVVSALWFFERGRAVAPRAASAAPEPAQLGAVVDAADEPSTASSATRNEVEMPVPSEPRTQSTPASSTSLLLRLVWADDKTPAAHVGAQLYQHGAEDYYQDKLRVETGDDGSVLVDPICAGGIGVFFDRGGFDNVEIERGTRNEATLTVPPGFDIEGHVREAGGRAVAGADVYLYTSVGSTYDGAVVAHSREDGSYRVRSVSGGGMNYLSARAPWRAPTKQRLVLSVAGATEKVDLVFEADGGAVEGRVLAPDGSPCANASVVIGRVDDFEQLQYDDGSNGLNAAPQRVFTDAQGHFAIAGVSEGTQPIRARAKGFAPAQGEVVVYAKHTTPRDISLVLGARLEGLVRDASGAPARASIDAAGGAGFDSSHRTTREDGTFEIDGLPLGEFGVAAESLSKGAAAAKFIGVSGATLRWDAVLSRGHVVRGRVEAPGEELAQWWIDLEDDRDSSFRAGPATTDASGRFEFIDCPDAALRLTLHRPSGGRWPAAVLHDVRPSGDELVIRPDPALDPSVRIRGRVVDPDGRPLAGAQIIPSLAGFNTSPIEKSRAADGAFELGPWPPGRWSLLVRARGFADFTVHQHALAPRETWELGEIVLTHGGQVVVGIRRAADLGEHVPQLVLTSATSGIDEWLQLEGDVARSRPLETGRYRLIASGEGIALATQEVEVTTQAETRIDLLVRRGAAFRVRIDDVNQSALGQRVDFTLAEDGGRTLIDGSFVPTVAPIDWTNTLAPGRYRFTARVAGREGVLDFEIGANAAPVGLTLRIP